MGRNTVSILETSGGLEDLEGKSPSPDSSQVCLLGKHNCQTLTSTDSVLVLNPSSATHQPHGLGQVSFPLWALVSSSVQWGC